MPRARSKNELLQFSAANYDTLMKLIDGMSEGIINIDSAGSVTFYNPAAERTARAS